MTKWFEAVKEKLAGDKKRMWLIVFLGIAAMLLLLLSECSGADGSEKTATHNDDSAEAYKTTLEAELEDIISCIDGAGKTNVMLTLQGSYEYIYALEEKTSSDSSGKTDTNGSEEKEIKNESESSYIIIDSENGEEALIKTTLTPSIAGVVVVCEGAENGKVRENIITAVTTALDISSKRVCVIQLQK